MEERTTAATSWRKLWLTSTVLAVSVHPGSLLHAQESAQDGTQQPPRDAMIDEVFVTATRRAVNIQDVPVSVTALTGEVLVETGITDAGQLTALAPNLQLTGNSSSRGATQFVIRGIGTSTFSHLLEGSVSVVIDGVPMGRAELGFTEFNDLARIEVLAGPQGMLFGKNATAGVINIVSERPRLGEVEGSATLSYGKVTGAPTNADRQIAQSVFNIPTSENSALRLNLSYTNHDSLFEQINPHELSDLGKSQKSIKGKFLWEPTDALSVYLIGDYADGNGLGVGLATSRGYFWGGSEPEDPQWITPGPENARTSADARTDLEIDVGGVSAELNYAFDSGYSLTNITAWRRFTGHVVNDNDGFSTPYAVFEAVFDYRQFSNEIRLESPRLDRFEFQTGFLFFDGSYERLEIDQKSLGGLPALVPGFERNVGTKDGHMNFYGTEYAVFGEGTYYLTDEFRLIFGGRYTYDETAVDTGYDARLTYDTGPPGGTEEENAAGRILVDTEREHDETDFSWRAGFQFDLGDNSMTYATYSRGYKGGGYNYYNADPERSGKYIEPEYAKVYELGLKSTFNRARLNMALFYGDYEGFQGQGYDPNIPAFIFTNAGNLNTKGFEAQLETYLTDDLSVTTNVAYVDAVYEDFQGAPCYGGQTAEQGCINGVYDASGNRLTNAPEWSGNIRATYAPMLTDSLMGRFRAEYSYRTDVNFAVTHHEATLQEGYGLLNLYAGVEDPDGRWSFSLFCKNCTDKRFVNYISPVQGLSRSYRQNFTLESFAQVGAQLNVRF